MDRLIRLSTDFLIDHGVIAPDDRDVYEYGFHAIYQNIFSLGVVVILAFLLRQVPQTLLFHIVFIPMKSVAGGYHATTRMRCFVISMVIWLASLGLIALVTLAPYVALIMSLTSCIIIWIIAPVEHENNPLSAKKRRLMMRLSRVISATFCLGTVAMLVAFPAYGWIGASIAVSMLAMSISLLVAYLQGRLAQRHAHDASIIHHE